MNFRDQWNLADPFNWRRESNSLTGLAWFVLLYFPVIAWTRDTKTGLIYFAVYDALLILSLITGFGRNLVTWVFAAMLNVVIPILALRFYLHERAAMPSVATLNRGAWIKLRQADAPALADAQRLAININSCLAKYRGNDSNESYPLKGEQLEMVNCQALLPSLADSAATRKNYLPADFGWRWTYAPGIADSQGRITDYKIRVFEDRVIARQSPEYVTDGSAVVWEYNAGKSPVSVATPIATLRLVSDCIAQVPALRAKDDPVKARYNNFPTPLDEMISRCSGLRQNVETSPVSLGHGHIALTARGGNGKLVDTVGVYGLSLIPVDEKHFIYEFQSGSISNVAPDQRNYFGARDGSIHVATGRLANADDPAVPESE